MLDTHKAILRLKEAGFEESKAEAIVESLQEVDITQVASKEDLLKLKLDLLKWVIPLIVGQYALLLGILLR